VSSIVVTAVMSVALLDHDVGVAGFDDPAGLGAAVLALQVGSVSAVRACSWGHSG
jgi:hypothetical protein